MTWPSLALPDALVTISPFAMCSIGATAGNFGAVASATWPAANRAIFYPIRVPVPFTSVNAWVMSGATWDGATPHHFDIGIYTLDGTLLKALGATNMNGTINAIQTAALAYTFGPGVFYLGLALDTATDTVFRSVASAASLKLLGCAQMASAYPLPAPATLATLGNSYLPLFGVSGRTTV